MDFRSQLSAFQNSSSSSGNNGYSGDRGRSSEKSYNNHNRNRKRSPNRDHYNDRDESRDRRRNHNHHHHYQGSPSAQRRRFNPPKDLDGLGDLRNFGYRIPRGFPPAPTEEEKKIKTRHLALLVLTIDDLPYEHIWKSWCETLSSDSIVNDSKYSKNQCKDEDNGYFISVVCHAKYPQNVKSEWLRQRLLTFPPKLGRGNSLSDPVHLSRTPNWGSVEITRAMLDLLQDGLKIGDKDSKQYDDERFDARRYLVRFPLSFDNTENNISNNIPPVDEFVFISESCLPVVTAPELFSNLTDSTVSWLNARHRTQDETPSNKYEDDQYAGINRRVPGQYRWKGDQWVLLSRRHASKIIGMDRPHIPPKHQLWQSFRHINASDEMFFPTALALLGYLRYTKDGYDTQMGRSRDEELSSQSKESFNSSFSSSGVLSSPKNARHNEAGNTELRSIADSGSSSSKNECIILKPLTYTDWSEGMKNPTLFTRGEIDFKRVSRLARDNGCLMARKFATHMRIPDIPQNEQKVTGEISVEQWISVIKELRSEEETKRSSLPTSEGEQNEQFKSSEENGIEIAKYGDGGDSIGDESNRKDERSSISRLSPPSLKATNEDEKGDPDGIDKDEGEFQLD